MIVLRNKKMIPKCNFFKQDSNRNNNEEPLDPPFGNPSQTTSEMRTRPTKMKAQPWDRAKEIGIRMIDPHFLKVVQDIRRPFELVANVARPNGRFVERQFRFYVKPDASLSSTPATTASGRGKDELLVVFRFCRALSSRVQADVFPPGLAVEVNGRKAHLPECSAPVDVSQYVFRSPRKPNRVSVVWKKQMTKYAMSISLTKKLSPFDLVRDVQSKPPIKKKDTIEKITKIFTADGSCQIVGGLPVNLRCPLGLAVIRVPVKSHLCNHISCFDALTYFCLNEFRPTWTCPLCGAQAPVGSLFVDEYLSAVLRSSELGDSKDILVSGDGSWKPLKLSAAPEANEPVQANDEVIVCDV